MSVRSQALASGLVASLCMTITVMGIQQVTKETVPGITNLARLETTVACAGGVTAEAVPQIKKMGFVSIINLRVATENGANVEAEEAAEH